MAWKEVYDLADLRVWGEATAGVEAPVRLAVFGDPIAHSLSPQMHNAALANDGRPMRYGRLHVRPEELAEALRLLPGMGFVGVNLTIPHKTAALGILDEIDGRAAELGAVNTVVVDGQRLRGFNTDGEGLVRAVRGEFGVDLRDLRVLVLGAGGGAGRAFAAQCALSGCQRLVLANRTREKTVEIAARLRERLGVAMLRGPFDRLVVIGLEEAELARQLGDIDLIINATSVGLRRGEGSILPSHLLLPHHTVFDTVYRAGGETRLVADARKAGARAVDGLALLLQQGAAAYEIWFDCEAPVRVMREALTRAAADKG